MAWWRQHRGHTPCWGSQPAHRAHTLLGVTASTQGTHLAGGHSQHTGHTPCWGSQPAQRAHTLLGVTASSEGRPCWGSQPSQAGTGHTPCWGSCPGVGRLGFPGWPASATPSGPKEHAGRCRAPLAAAAAAAFAGAGGAQGRGCGSRAAHAAHVNVCASLCVRVCVCACVRVCIFHACVPRRGKSRAKLPVGPGRKCSPTRACALLRHATTSNTSHGKQAPPPVTPTHSMHQHILHISQQASFIPCDSHTST